MEWMCSHIEGRISSLLNVGKALLPTEARQVLYSGLFNWVCSTRPRSLVFIILSLLKTRFRSSVYWQIELYSSASYGEVRLKVPGEQGPMRRR